MKKKKDKVLVFIKNNWYFVLLIIPFIFFCIENRTTDNDIWFLLNNGRYVFYHGIPYIEPFTIHEGLNYVMQQWASALIFFVFFKTFGKYGLLALMFIVFVVITTIYYNLCKMVTNNKKISLIVTVLVMYMMKGYIVSRPQIFTYIIFILELLCMEKYVKNDNGKYLIWMPILSLLLINLHASMWLLQFVFMLPVVCNCIRIKNITIDKVRIKPLIITIILMILLGFINPYGYKAITFVFSTYGIPEINKLVTEMETSAFSMWHWKIAILELLVIVVLIALNKKVKLDIRDILFLCGSFLFASLHGKCIVYFILYSGFILAKILSYYEYHSILKDIKKLLEMKYIKSLGRGLVFGLFFCLIFTFFFTTKELISNYRMERSEVGSLIQYIVDNYDEEKSALYIGFYEGGYAEYQGIKSYMDPRAEVFHDKLNKKENILKEYFDVCYGLINYDDFINKYNFSHIIVRHSEAFNDYLTNNPDYVNEYTTYLDVANNVPYFELYVKKDLSIKEVYDEEGK